MKKDRVLIMGAAGRDFHNFNVYFRGNEAYEVVAFTATQIPNIEGRAYPSELAGPDYPDGIPIYQESKLTDLIKELDIDQVVFGYSDVSHDYVMHRASMVLAVGADFRLMGGKETMLQARVPVVSVCAVRTGCGKSQTSRRVSDILREMGRKAVVVRHPMPYGDLVRQACQRFATYDDLDKQQCTIEEREEYEPHLDRGMVVYAGVDYEQILRQAEQEAEVILWDGGNNDLPFYKPDLHIVVADPHRAGHEVAYHPGEANLRLADVVVINKVDTGDLAAITTVHNNVHRVNPQATIIEAASPIFVEEPSRFSKSTLKLDHSCQLWATARSRSRNWGRLSTTPLVTWSSWPRPLTCGGWWRSVAPPSECATSYRRSASRPLRTCLAQSLARTTTVVTESDERDISQRASRSLL
jgi:predicted GTPase